MTVLETFADALLAAPAAVEAARIQERLRLHLLDTIGAMHAGAACAEGRALAATGGVPELFDGGLPDRLALAVAQTRLTETDDIHMASCTTIGSVIVPTALLLGAAAGVDRTRRDAGLRAGYDAMARLGSAVDGARILYKGIWPTYLCAPFGAAACAAVILGLDSAKTADALAIALAQVSGAAGGPAAGRNSRWLYAGWAAAAGVRAALAARDGFSGDLSLLDGKWFETTHGIAFETASLAGAPGSALLEMSLKPWCTAKQASSALAGFIELLDGGIQAADIAAVRIHVPQAYRAMIAHQPPGRIGRIVSIGWQCAVAAYRREGLFDIERADFSALPEFATLAKKIQVIVDPALDAHFPHTYPARVEVEMTDGARLEKLVINAPGDPAAPLDEAAVTTKFIQVCKAVMGAEAAQQALARAQEVMS